MARIQVMPLTPVTVGEYTRTPFVLIVDHLDGEEFTAAECETLKEASSAHAVMVTSSPIDVATPLQLTDEQRDTLTTHLLHLTTAP